MPPRTALIAGAGPAGLTAAIELARRGIEPRIVDPKAGPVDESRALAVNPRTMELLGPSGAAERIAEEGIRLRRLNWHEGDRLRFSIDYADLSERQGFMVMLPQPRTEAILAEVLAEVGVEVEWGTRLATVDAESGACELESGDRRDRVTAELVVGADGARSTVREQARIEFAGTSHPELWGLADLVLRSELPTDEAPVYRDGRVIMALFPLGGRHFRLVGSSAESVAVLRRQLDIDEVRWESEFRIAARQAEMFSRGRVHLCGDAAHVHSPFGGRGMNLGIEDAAWLAWLATEDRLAEYSPRRMPVARQVIRFTDGATRLLTRSRLIGTAVIRFVMPVAMGIRPVHRRALTNVSGLASPDPPWLAH